MQAVRSDLVRRYRERPSAWPEGIDSAGDPWYREHEHEWADDGSYVGSDSFAQPVSPEAVSGEAVNSEPVSASSVTPVSREEARRAYMRNLMRARRAAERGV